MGAEDALLGTEIGNFRLVRLLGRGGMGRVYLGVNESIGSRVAIKVLAEDLVDSPEILERFFTEARAVNLIAHENIVSISDLDRLDGGRPYIVMEFIEGKTLRELLQASPGLPLPLGGCLRAVVDVLLALEAAHDKGIVHRDLKPDNVILTASGRAKVLDFGIAKLVEGPALRTATGVLLGTPHYMAPEQILGTPADGRTDVYAVGVMLFELVTGSRPFDAPTDFALMEAQVRTPAPTARAVPVAIAEIVAKALAKAPADRFASAQAMADAVTAALAALPAATAPSFSPATLKPAPITIESFELATAAASPNPRSNATARELAETSPGTPTAATVREPTNERAPATPRRRASWLVGALGTAALAAALYVAFGRPDAPRTATPLAAAPVIDAALVGAPPPDAVVAVDAADVASVDAAVALAVTPDAKLASKVARDVPMPGTSQGKACKSSTDCPSYGCWCGGDIWHLNSNCAAGRCLTVPAACKATCVGKPAWTGRWNLSWPIIEGDCVAAPECTSGGSCKLIAGEPGSGETAMCAKNCANTKYCQYQGLCADGPDHTCLVTEAGCRATDDCTRMGLCAIVDGKCTRSAAGCAAASTCTETGECGFDGTTCVPRTAEDCQRSDGCHDAGLCSLGTDRCVATDDATCQAAPSCKRDGRCKWAAGACVATDLTCQASAACKDRGRCRAVKGGCEK